MWANCWKLARTLLLIWGIISLTTVSAFSVYVYRQFSNEKRERINEATNEDARFVLNWCGLGEDKIRRVVHSYESSRSITGDHLDAYAIKILNIDEDDLNTSENGSDSHWYRGSELPPAIDEALGFLASWLHQEEVAWFPKEKRLRSNSYYVYPWTIRFSEARVTSIELIFVNPEDDMVYFFSAKV